MFKRYLVALDMALTGNDRARVEQFFSAPHNYFDVVDFVQRGEIHLSDGGYSRIVWSEMEGNFFLTSNSRQEVMARWEALYRNENPQSNTCGRHLTQWIRSVIRTRRVIWVCISTTIVTHP